MTYLSTELLPIDDNGGYLLVHGIEDSNSGRIYREDTRLAAALSGHLDSEATTDLLSSFTVPRPASESAARNHRKRAEAHRGISKSGDGGPSQARYMQQCSARQEYSALIAETDQLWLPCRVAASRNGTAAFALSTTKQDDNTPDKTIVRHIDCASGKTLLERSHAATRFGFATDAYKEYQGFLAMDTEARSLLVQTVPDRMKQNARLRLFLEERSLTKKLKTVCKSEESGNTHSELVGQSVDYWFMCSEDFESRNGQITVLDKNTCKRIDQFDVARKPSSIAVSRDGNLIAMGFMGCAVWVLDRTSGKMRKFAPHIGARRDNSATVQISDAGDFVVSKTLDDTCVTSLDNGTSASLGKLKDVTHESDAVEGVDTDIRIQSAIAILGDRIGIAEDGAVREVSRSPADYDNHFVSETGRKGARKPVKVTRKAPIEESISKARLEPHQDTLLHLRSPAAVVNSKKLGKRGWSQPGVQHAPELGASRFGGWPDLQKGADWPMADGRPMAFLAQVNLEEAHAAQPELKLPGDGLLSFFLGCIDDTYTKDGDSRERYMADIAQDRPAGAEPGYKVIYTPAAAKLERLEYEDGTLPELADPAVLKLKPGGKPLPDEQSTAQEALPLTAFERADYIEMVSQLQSDNQYHQLMGYPSLIQFTPPELYCEAGSFDFPSDPDSEEYRAFAEKAAEWTMLLQLYSDPTPDFLWGDGGKFYFYIRRSDLAKQNFDDVRVYFEN